MSGRQRITGHPGLRTNRMENPPLEHQSTCTVNHQWPRRRIAEDGNEGRNSCRSVQWWSSNAKSRKPNLESTTAANRWAGPATQRFGRLEAGRRDVRMAGRAVAQCFIHQTPLPPRAFLGTTPGNAHEEAHLQVCSVLLSKADCVYYIRNFFTTHFWTRQTFYCVPLEE